MAREATPPKKRIAAASIFIAAASTLALAIYLWLTPIDISAYAPEISSFIGQRTGRRVSIDSVIVRFLPHPDITIKGLNISDKDDSFLRSGSVRVTVSYLPLLMRRVHLKSLDMKGVTIRVRRYPDAHTNIDDIIGASRDGRGGAGFRLEIGSARLESGTLLFTDLAAEGQPSFEVAGLRGKWATEGGAKRFELEGMLVPGTRVSLDGVIAPGMITGAGHIAAIDLGRLAPYAGSLSKGASLNGKADAAFSYTHGMDKEIRARLDYTGLVLRLPEVLEKSIHSPKGSAVVKASGKRDGTVFEVEDANLFFPGFSVAGFLSVSGPSDGRMIRARLSSTPAPLASFIGLMPIKALPQRTKEAAAGFTPEGGSITLKTLEIDSRLSGLRETWPASMPPVTLILKLDDLSFRLKGFDGPFSGVGGTVSLKGGNITVENVLARYGKNVLRSADATLRDITGDTSYGISAEGTLDAGAGLSLARDLTEGKYPAWAKRLSKAEASGFIKLSIDALGSLKDKTPKRYAGSIFIEDATFRYEGLPLSIESLSADAVFNERQVEIKGLRASDGRSFIVMNGQATGYAGAYPSFALAAEAMLDSSTIAALAKETAVADGLYTDGSASIKLTAEGGKDSARISLLADATPAWIAYRDYIRKEEDYPASFEAFMEASDAGVTIRRAALKIGSSTIEFAGRTDTDARTYDLKANSPELFLGDLDSISPYLRSEYPSSGLVSFEINAARASDEAHPYYKGAVAVKGARFETPFLKSTVERLDAAASFDGKTGRLHIDRMDVGRSDLSGTIDIIDIAGRKIRFDIASTHLDSSDLIPKERMRSLARHKSKPPVTGSGSVAIDGGVAWGHSFKGLKAAIDMENDHVYIRPLSMEVDGGRLDTAVSYHRDDQDPVLFEAAAEASEIDIKPMLSAFGAKKDILAGSLSGRGVLWGKRGAEPFSSGLNGDLRLEASAGRLWKFQVMAGIFSVVNILSIDELFEEGLPYKTLSGNFTIRDGIISTEEMNLDSASLRMSATGEIDLPNSIIHGILAMHPLVTIDKIISNIPLAGYIITGKNESTASIYFSVEGPLRDAEVSLLPVKSVEEGVLGILERLIKTPIRLLETQEKK